jgi:hypothetical protein
MLFNLTSQTVLSAGDLSKEEDRQELSEKVGKANNGNGGRR